MATGTFNWYNCAPRNFLNGTYDADGHTFIMSLHTSAYTPSVAHSALTQVTGELSGSGYSRFTATVTFEATASFVMFDLNDMVWTASGGTMKPYYWVLWDATASSALVAYGLVDQTPATAEVSTGNTFTLQFNANGLFRLTW